MEAKKHNADKSAHAPQHEHSTAVPRLDEASTLKVSRDSVIASSQMHSAWTDDHLTREQLDWVASEHKFLAGYAQPRDLIVDFGCGDCRVLKALAASPYSRYVGIDIDPVSVETASKEHPSSGEKVHEFMHGDGSKLISQIKSTEGPAHGRVLTICIGNTLGSFGQGRTRALKNMLEHSDAVIVSVCENTPETMMMRLGYYQKNNLKTQIHDWTSGSIYSDMWGESKSFSEETLIALARESAADDLGFAVRFERIPPLGIALILEKLDN